MFTKMLCCYMLAAVKLACQQQKQSTSFSWVAAKTECRCRSFSRERSVNSWQAIVQGKLKWKMMSSPLWPIVSVVTLLLTISFLIHPLCLMAGSIKTQYDHRFLLQLGQFGLVALTAPTAGRGSNYIRLAYCFFQSIFWLLMESDRWRQMENMT